MARNRLRLRIYVARRPSESRTQLLVVLFLSFSILALLTVAAARAELVREGSGYMDQTFFGEIESVDDYFGSALASGDFNCDGIDDAVFGTPSKNLFPGLGENAHGQVIVAYGSPDGIPGPFDVVFQQGDGLPDEAEFFDEFGMSVAVGNFDGLGCEDLAIGVPGETLSFGGDQFSAGAVQVLYGWQFAGGLSPIGSQFLHRASTDMVLSPESDDRFGWALAAGDFDDDGEDDLAIGVPGDGLDGNLFVGSVHVIYGSPNGLDPLGLDVQSNHVLTQALAGGLNEQLDYWGSSLTAADFNGDGRVDLAVGGPYETVDEIDDAGSVVVFYGGPTGLLDAASQYLDQSSPGVSGQVGENHAFGYALAAADFDADGFGDLSVGIPGHMEGPQTTGQVLVFYGFAGGLSTNGVQSLSAPSLTGAAPANIDFGTALASGDFDGRGGADLAIGATNDSAGAVPQAGSAFVVSGQEDRTFDLELVLYVGDGVPGDPTNGQFGAALGTGDVNGDGRDDLLVGNPTEDGTRGATIVFYSHGIFSADFESGDLSQWSAVSP